ncbi:MAG TPA: Helicase associated domain protein [Streptosporangiaceae bacterium]|nr:Helicase associated domain protein [Streptosporangiaceae bacterium]
MTALRPYQAEAVEAIIAGLRDGGRGQVRMACGTGKTLVAARAAAEVAGRGGVVVLLVPSIALAAQMIRAWPAGCPVDHVFAVCSDYTVAGGGVRAADLAVPVSTDPEVIAKWLADTAGRVLVVGTYDSAHRLAQALRRAGQVAELTVCDEAHRLAGAADKATAAILAPDVMPERRRLYLTATPRVGTGISAGGELLVASMDDEAVFGPVLHAYSFRRGIADGWLKDYRIVIAALADSQVRQLLEGNPGLVGEGGVPVRMAAAQAALAMTAARFGLRRTLAFVPRIAQAREFAATLPATVGLLPQGQRPGGPVVARFVHGEMSSAQREMVLDRLRHPPQGGWSVVANARCLGEGVDVPAIDSVLFAAPKTSVIDIVQAVGRALRRHDDAGTATIIVPALLPDSDGDAAAGQGDGGRFENVLRVIRALCAHDDALAAGLGDARAARASTASGREPGLPGQIVVHAPPGTVAQALQALRIRIVDGATPAWYEGYGHARAWQQQHGHLGIPTAYICEGGFRLGSWLSSQRVLRNRGQLAADRRAALDELGMIWDVLDEAWMQAYQDACAWHDQHGHLEVPADVRTADGTGLAAWLASQRSAWRYGTLAADRIALLEKIGAGQDAGQERWMRRYRQLADALDSCGGQRYLPPGCPEAVWLENQRAAHRTGKLSADKITLLENADIVLRRADMWHSAYEALAGFHAAHGHTRVPRRTLTPAGIDLGAWVTSQRARKARLTSEQIRLLDQIAFCWNAREDTWHARYQEAADFKNQHGHLNATFHTPLGAWLYQQRKKHRTGRLTSQQEQLLNNIGALSDPADGTGT